MEEIQNKEELSVALALSYDYPILVLKVSNTCPQSRSVFDEFKKLEEKSPDLAERIFVLIVQKAREVSDEIAMRFGVVHESPQALVVKDEDVIYYESHEQIKVSKIKELLQKEDKEEVGDFEI